MFEAPSTEPCTECLRSSSAWCLWHGWLILVELIVNVWVLRMRMRRSFDRFWMPKPFSLDCIYKVIQDDQYYLDLIRH